ncbi:hypothetical protein [Antiquaquibacter soli]|uniref:Uncharacterized protein n=1 Tax=Antiquaquibacter soli TaxID=3064523 RepID=A0ABT9BQ62_9MICO|nr:hypothetical protein [Protaetiibacter sp. WY-16]MDO7882562.1 hypothetical protein [Protaetiibacter sp. WY-16]
MTSVLDVLVGETLDAVVFVADYSQVQFTIDSRPERVNFGAWPEVAQTDRIYRFGEPGYRDAYCELIGRKVTGVVEWQTRGLGIEFDDRSLIITIAAGLAIGPYEIADFRTWIWRSDLPPFGGTS